mgnify:CR=1 FL=1
MTDKEAGRTSNRGFASMDPEKQREIAAKGGESVPAAKRSFSRNPELAAEAGRKGGRSVPAQARSFARNPALAAEAGRKGGQASHTGQQGGGQPGGGRSRTPPGEGGPGD